jgi:heme A synthase
LIFSRQTKNRSDIAAILGSYRNNIKNRPMNGIPWFSTFTLFTEIIVTSAILYVIYTGYVKNEFPGHVAAAALSYEILFNISYMASRLFTHEDSTQYPDSPFHVALAIFHGTFSLIMFVLLLVFMFFAWRGYRSGKNYFRIHKKLMVVFLISWMIAVLSGFLFYYEAYFSPEEILTRQAVLLHRNQL